jgi:hypothetical protein
MSHDILDGAIMSPDSPNLLIYGSSRVDKYSAIFQVICDHYQLQSFDETTKHEFSYKFSKNYHEFNMSQIRHSNTLAFWEMIHDIIGHTNYFGSHSKNVILIRNFNNIKGILQTKWRVFLEKFHKTTRFIFLTDNFTGIIEPIRSRFLCIRMPEIVSVWSNSERPQDIVCSQLMKLYDHDFRDIRQCDIQKIKDISYNLLKYSVNIQEFYRELSKQCLRNPKWIHSIKYRLLSEIVKSEQRLKHAYRMIIHVESLLLNLYYLTSFAHYEIDRHQEEGVHVLQDAAGPQEDDEE